jgi:tight adherence protein B
MTGFLLGLLFAAGVGIVWAGLTRSEDAAGDDALRRFIEAHRRSIPTPRFAALGIVGAVVLGALAWSLARMPMLAVVGALGGAYAPVALDLHRREARRRARERGWPAALAQLADALEAGIAFPAAVALVAEAGPEPLRAELAAFHARLRAGGLAAALAGLSEAGERTNDTIGLLLRAGLLELPTGGLAPVLRELAEVLSERFEARETARSRASTLQLEAAVLAVSPIALLLLVGAASPGYLDAYRTAGGTVVAAIGALLIFGCYLLMRRLGRVPEPRRTGVRR